VSDVDEVKARVDIVDLVGESVALQRAGRNFKALCPFHTEKTPSFHVFPDRQTWHCFGACGIGGDVLTFVMKRDGVEFRDALRLLADRAGVALGGRTAPKEDERQRRLLSANEAAGTFFHQALLHSSDGANARAYLAGRGVDAEAIASFQLGYSADGWEALKSHLLERGFTQEELLAAGLLVESERGGYDRFRGRLMFPIRDERGRTVGFGGRALEADATPKYINTPQSPIFDKGGLLYALDRAKEPIRRQGSVIIVEGYMDVIAAHQHGIANVVASMGTALTERQVGLLKRYTRNVVLCLDADTAGNEATLRGLQVAGEALDKTTVPVPTWRGLIRHQETLAADIRVVSLPEGLDPDEAIRSQREVWDRLVAEAKPVLDYLFDAVAGRLDLTQPRQRARAVDQLLPLVGAVSEPVVRVHYLQRLARLAQVDEATLRAALRPPSRRRPDASEAVQAPSHAPREPGEEFALALLLKYPQLRAEGERLSPDLFLLEEHRALFAAWRESADLASLRESLPTELHPLLDRMQSRSVPALEGADLLRALEDCVARIELRRLSQAKQASTSALLEQHDELNGAAWVEEARSIWEQGAGPAGERGGSVGQEAAIALVRDMELGRRIHRPRTETEEQHEERPSGERDQP